MADISEYRDYLDVRDIIERYCELEDERQSLVCAIDGAKENLADAKDDTSALADDAEELADLQTEVDKATEALEEWNFSLAGEEFTVLEELLNDLRDKGGDHQWEGDWYPVSLIRDSYFTRARDELLEDIGELPKNLPSYLKIEVDYDALQQGYSSVEYNGVTYWAR